MILIASSTCSSSTPTSRVAFPRLRKPPTVLMRVTPYRLATRASATRPAERSSRMESSSFVLHLAQVFDALDRQDEKNRAANLDLDRIGVDADRSIVDRRHPRCKPGAAGLTDRLLKTRQSLIVGRDENERVLLAQEAP